MNVEYLKLKELIRLKYGKALKKAERKGGPYAVYGSNGIVGYHSDHLIEKPSIIIGRKGSVGELNYSDNPSWPIDTAYGVEIIDEGKLNLRYLFYALKCLDISDIIQKGVKPGINRNDYLEKEIPHIEIEEQKRIVEKLDSAFEKIDEAVGRIQMQKKHILNVINNYLFNLFVNKLQHIEKKPLNEIATVARGKSKHRPRNDKRLFGGSYPFIQTGDVRNSKKYINQFSKKYNELGLKQSKLWRKGTICLTIAANIGDVGILSIDACFPDSVVGITTSKMDHEFLYYYLKTLQSLLDSKANSAAQKNINLQILSEIEVPVPPLKKQKELSKKISKLEEKTFLLLDKIEGELTMLEQLKESILDSAFNV